MAFRDKNATMVHISHLPPQCPHHRQFSGLVEASPTTFKQLKKNHWPDVHGGISSTGPHGGLQSNHPLLAEWLAPHPTLPTSPTRSLMFPLDVKLVAPPAQLVSAWLKPVGMHLPSFYFCLHLSPLVKYNLPHRISVQRRKKKHLLYYWVAYLRKYSVM